MEKANNEFMIYDTHDWNVSVSGKENLGLNSFEIKEDGVVIKAPICSKLFEFNEFSWFTATYRNVSMLMEVDSYEINPSSILVGLKDIKIPELKIKLKGKPKVYIGDDLDAANFAEEIMKKSIDGFVEIMERIISADNGGSLIV